MSLAPGCKVDSLYEIWSVTAKIMTNSGRQVAFANIASAVFDPITVFDPASPTRVVNLWDPAVDAILNGRTTRVPVPAVAPGRRTTAPRSGTTPRRVIST